MPYPDKKLGRKRKGVIPLRKSDTPTIIVRYQGECSRCGHLIRKGEWARFNPEKRTIRHARNCKQQSSRVSTRKPSGQ